MILVEGIACSADDARIAENSGVHRLEVCSSMVLGGLTPSLGSFKAIREETSLDLIAMIRPRGSGFCYSNQEYVAMLYDTDALFQAGANGIAFGILDERGQVDLARCQRLISHAQGKQVVFHRAFDATPEPTTSLETLIDLGVTRILTSGQAHTALLGADLIRRLIEQAAGRIEILVGGGVRPDTVHEIVAKSGATQVHLGPFGSLSDPSAEVSQAAKQSYGATYPIADGETLSKVVQALNS